MILPRRTKDTIATLIRKSTTHTDKMALPHTNNIWTSPIAGWQVTINRPFLISNRLLPLQCILILPSLILPTSHITSITHRSSLGYRSLRSLMASYRICLVIHVTPRSRLRTKRPLNDTLFSPMEEAAFSVTFQFCMLYELRSNFFHTFSYIIYYNLLSHLHEQASLE